MVMESRRAGVGLVLEARGRGPSFVAELAAGGSADRSGKVQVGDKLLLVDGNPLDGMTPVDLAQVISGPEGTPVRLSFCRVTTNFFHESEETFEVTLMRAVPPGGTARAVPQGLASARHTIPVQQPQRPKTPTEDPQQSRYHTYLPTDKMGEATTLPAKYGTQPTNQPPPIWEPAQHVSVAATRTAAPMLHNSHSPQSVTPHNHTAIKSDSTDLEVQRLRDALKREQTVRSELQQELYAYKRASSTVVTASSTVAGRASPRLSVNNESVTDVPPRMPHQHQHTHADAGGGSPSIQMLEAELRRLLAFVKSGYTNATHQESEWMQGDSVMAELLRTIYRDMGAIKSREASSENVLRVAKETLDARKKQIRTLTITLKKLQGQQSLSGMGLSGSMDSASQISIDKESTGSDEQGATDHYESMAQEAMKEAASTKRKLDRALLEIGHLRQKLKATGGGEDGAPEAVHPAATNTDATNADIVAQKDAMIKALEEKLKYLEEDHRKRSERITEVSERLMLKRKEERDMMEDLKRQMEDLRRQNAAKDQAILNLRNAQGGGENAAFLQNLM